MRQKIKRTFRVARYIVYRETLVDKKDIFWSFLGAFTGIGLIGFLHQYWLSAKDNLFLVGSFGASAVLIYGHTQSPLAQPRNLVGGHILSALVGITIRFLIPAPELQWLACSLAVALAIVLMQVTRTIHPPGGATSLLAIIGSDKIRDLGYLYALSPVASGVAIMLLIAWIVNNIPANRKYPAHGKWW
jgi:CBS domain-containing membrane protein